LAQAGRRIPGPVAAWARGSAHARLGPGHFLRWVAEVGFRAKMHSDVYIFVLSFSEADLNEFLINFEGLNFW
jgi:hypothetical protein